MPQQLQIVNYTGDPADTRVRVADGPDLAVTEVHLHQAAAEVPQVSIKLHLPKLNFTADLDEEQQAALDWLRSEATHHPQAAALLGMLPEGLRTP